MKAKTATTTSAKQVDANVGSAVVQADVLGKDAGDDHADHPAHAVTGEHVEGVVERASRFPVDREIADDAGHEPDDDAVANGDKSAAGVIATSPTTAPMQAQQGTNR